MQLIQRIFLVLNKKRNFMDLKRVLHTKRTIEQIFLIQVLKINGNKIYLRKFQAKSKINFLMNLKNYNMSNLKDKKCAPCEGGVIPFDISEIHKYQKKVDGWDI